MNRLRSLWGWLVERVESVAGVFLPILFLIADILIRIGFGIGAGDAGADMCMAAIAARVCSLIAHGGGASGRKAFYGDVLLIVIYGCLWILCLLLVSRIPQGSTQFNTKVGLIWSIGFLALFTALYKTLLEVRRE